MCSECGGFKVLAKLRQHGARQRARRLGLSFDLTVNDVLELIGDGICPVLGTPYDMTLHRQGAASTSLDRFFPELGYTKQNCFVISNLANMIKSNANSEQVRRVADWMELQERIFEGEVAYLLKFNGVDYERCDASELFGSTSNQT
jgi:hypothetical protein